MKNKESNRILIAAVTPSFLERGALWFKENEGKIIKAAQTQSWWQKNIVVLETGSIQKLSELMRSLAELGYQKTQSIVSPGEFAQLGDTVRISPVNREDIVRLEFRGNTVESIAFETFRFPEAAEKPPKAKRAFREGEYIVHLDHGIGVYRGIVSANNESVPNKRIRTFEKDSLSVDEHKFHVIEYAAPRANSPKDRLLVPLNQEKKLSLYIGFETPTIHRLGGQLWPNTKRKIKASAEAFARELLKIYAAREEVSRPPLTGDPAVEQSFADKFQFVETPSQSRASDEILADLENIKPMDRVLAGDVGFGKTEVAMRAAMRAVLSGHQVAVLAPTTILVEQHERTFRERFADFPVKIAALSRLIEKGEEKKIVAELTRGEIDIVIGTHRLLAKDVQIPKLGLLIIDEEQKFGVLQKEHFKKLRASIDILSLSATPIPRTLSLAMANLRGISQITDPPPERLAVKNFVLPWSEEIIKNAILEELKRDGQVYLLHNRVETIGVFAKNMQALAPEAKVGVIHGRIDEQELLKTLTCFRNKEINVLVATTIIENGLDFSNVNTLIVENSTRLGLAQAYQIRGRIGRSDRQAFAYFLYPAQHLTDGARERLETLEAFEALGSGYEIALRDLEMRGAGAILGREQSGAIQKGGLNLYCQLLADALENLKSAESPSLTKPA